MARRTCSLSLVLALLTATTPAICKESNGRSLVGLGVGTALGLGPWFSPSLALSLGHRFDSNLYLGGHSAFVFGRSEHDSAVDRMHHHALELGYALGGEHVLVIPGLRAGALFFMPGDSNTKAFVAPLVAAGTSAFWRAGRWLLGGDLRLIYPFQTMDRGDTSQGLAAISLEFVVGRSW